MPDVVLPLDPIAIFTHNHASYSPLNSYSPVPADTLHQGELLAIKAFGSLLEGIRSPRHMYMACWRDPDFHGQLPENQTKAPNRILVSAQFGRAPYETPASLLELAEMFNRLDRAGLRLEFVRDADGVLRLDSLELELNSPLSATDRLFRSCWKGAEVSSLDVAVQFHAPATRLDPFRFHMQGRLPRRYNHGEKIEREHVEFSASGGAMPIPPWVNY
jgi:hypothetical protein